MLCSATLTRERASRKILSGFVFFDRAAAIADNDSAILQRYSGLSAGNRVGGSLQCVIRNIKGEKLFVSLGHASVVPVLHESSLPNY